MTCAMRILAILMVAALTTSAARSETLSAADREALLDNLEKLRDAAVSKVDSRSHTAMRAYREAMGSDDAALELYLKSVEKVNFVEQQKKSSDFLEWKRKDDVKAQLSDPAFRVALRYQLRWLVLTLQASSDKANPRALAAEAQEIVDLLFRDAPKLAGQGKLLQTPVTSTEFAKAGEIVDLKKDKWPLSPLNLDEIYGTIVFPPLRTPERLAALRAAWIKRIQQEGIKAEAWGGSAKAPAAGAKGKNDHKNSAAAEISKDLEHEKFITERQPDLQWQMEVDLFRCGDESAAAMRMLSHIEKHITHKSARKWGEEFRNLLKPPAPAAPAAQAGTP